MLAMCNNNAFGVAPVIDQITKKTSAAPTKGVAAKKAMNSNKLIIGKYQTLARILAEVGDIAE